VTTPVTPSPQPGNGQRNGTGGKSAEEHGQGQQGAQHG
jgi:hypothetical protein